MRSQYLSNLGFPGHSVVKNPPANAGNRSLIPGLRRSSGEGNGNPLQYCCQGNSMDRGAWRATVHGVAKELDTTEANNTPQDTPAAPVSTGYTEERIDVGRGLTQHPSETWTGHSRHIQGGLGVWPGLHQEPLLSSTRGWVTEGTARSL